MNPIIPIAFVFIGCCSNVIFLELIIREEPGSGNIITFAQFFFIACEGFIVTTNFCRKPSAIPLRTYFTMVALFFFTNVINNYALKFDVPMPLHMIFRAGSLIANLVLGVILLHRRYKFSKYFSVVMITAGIALSTLASSDAMSEQHNESNGEDGVAYKYGRLGIGVSLLTTALFLSAYMGIFQEKVYSEYGKHPDEALFYNHALPLPFFILLSKDIYAHAQIFTASEPLMVPFLEFGVPRLWLFLLGNVLTQYVCIKSVFILTTECTSLAVTLVVTLRKFVSLIFSILYFNNPFTSQHWFGTVLVFGGTFIFMELGQNIYKALVGTNTKPATKMDTNNHINNHVDKKVK